MPKNSTKDDLPGTLKRSPAKAQRTWLETHDSAAETYGDGERAHRTAFSSLKHSFEKVGDHWEPKKGGRKGPSDEQAAKGGRRQGPGGRAGGEGWGGGTPGRLDGRRRGRQGPHQGRIDGPSPQAG